MQDHSYTLRPDPELPREMDKLTGNVGSALSAWAGVEQQLDQTFHYAMTSGSRADILRLREVHTAVLRAAGSVRARTKMVDIAVKSRLQEPDDAPLIAEWAALAKRAYSLADKRNKLAHRAVALVTTAPFDPIYEGDLGVRLVDLGATVPSHQSYAAFHLNNGLTAGDVSDMIVEFAGLAGAIYEHGRSFLDHINPAPDG